MPKKPAKKTGAAQESADDFEDEILSRFLVDKNDNIRGESIGIEGTNLIIKHKNKFYIIPRKAVKLVGKKLVLKRKVDWVAALAKGKGWKKEELDPLWGKKTEKKKSKPTGKKKPSKKGKGKATVSKKKSTPKKHGTLKTSRSSEDKSSKKKPSSKNKSSSKKKKSGKGK
jgi:hypothetical protein